MTQQFTDLFWVTKTEDDANDDFSMLSTDGTCSMDDVDNNDSDQLLSVQKDGPFHGDCFL